MQPQNRKTVQIKLDYEPHPFQKKFHDSTKMIRLLSSGIRGGKSVCLIMEAIKRAHVGWSTFGVPNVGCIVSPDFSMMQDILLPIFEDVVNKANVKYGFDIIDRFPKSGPDRMTCYLKNGSKIMFRSADHPNSLRGKKLQWFGLDEPREMKASVYDIMHGRIADSDGIGFLATTTKGRDWVYEKIIVPFNNKTDLDIDVVKFTSYDNPHFPKHRIDKLKQLYSDDFFRQECLGEIVIFKGVIYKDFSRFTHVKSFETDNLKYFIAGVDFGYLQPATLLIGFDSDGNVYVCDEWYESEQLNSALIHNLKLWNEKTPLEVLYCDPAGLSQIKELQAAELNAVAANNAVMFGINKVNEFIRPGKLFIHPRCVNLIKELEVYHFREGTEVPLKVMDHACFPAGTMITIKGGDKPIEEVEVGDMALTRKGYRKVLVSGMTEEYASIVRVTLANGTTLECTINHPIMVTDYYTGEERFKSACVMYHGEFVHLIKGNYSPVENLTILKRGKPVYNMTVEGEHEYYANGILSHNCDALRYSLAGPKKEEEVIEESTDYAVTF